MNITISIDDDQMSEIIKNGINDMPKEQIDKIVTEAITKYLSTDSVMEKILFTKDGYYNTVPSDTLKGLLRIYASNTSRIVELQNELIDYVEKNKEKVLRGALADTIAQSLMDSNFKENLAIRFSRIENEVFDKNK